MDKRIYYVLGAILIIGTIIFGVDFNPKLTGHLVAGSSEPSSNSEWTNWGRDLGGTRFLDAQTSDNLTSGIIRTYNGPGNYLPGIAPVVSEEYVYYVFSGGTIVQLNASNVSQEIARTSGIVFDTNIAITSDFIFSCSQTSNLCFRMNKNNVSLILQNVTARGMDVDPLVYQDYLYFLDNGDYYQVNASNFSQVIGTKESCYSYSYPAIYGEYFYTDCGGTNIYQLNASNIGQEINSMGGAGIFYYVRSPLAIKDGSIYVGEDEGKFYRINATNLDQTIETGAIYSSGKIAVSDDSFYLLKTGGIIVKYSVDDFSQSETSIDLNFNTFSISKEYVYGMGSSSGLVKLNISNLTQVIENYSFGTANSYISLTQDYIYFVNTTGTLFQIGDVYGGVPQFSNFVDNSGELTTSGMAEFNVTVETTNGTVYLNINGKNETAINVYGDVYHVNLTLTSGSYDYYWLGYGSLGEYGISETQIYIVNAEVVEEEPEPSTSSGGSTGLPAEHFYLGDLEKVDTITLDLKYGEKIFFNSSDIEYDIFLKNIDRTNNEAIFKILPIMEEVSLRLYENKDIDLNGDGIVDINLVLEKIISDKVEVELVLKRKVIFRDGTEGHEIKAISPIWDEAQCTDTDGGINLIIKGVVEFENAKQEDYCYKINLFGFRRPSLEGNYIREYFCEEGAIKHNNYPCPEGCVDGVCKKELPQCTDTDGGKEIFIKGITEYDGTKKEDYCYLSFFGFKIKKDSAKNINEYFCGGGVVVEEGIRCPEGCIDGACVSSCIPNTCEDLGYECGECDDGCKEILKCGECEEGYSCLDGECILDSVPLPVCSDSDGGLNYFVKGIVTDREGINQDYCNGSILIEGICEGLFYGADKHNCSNGCIDGACIGNIICQDTDSGDINVSGSVIVDGRTYSDHCLMNYHLKEYSCLNNGSYIEEIIECPCLHGACVNIEAICSDPDGIIDYYFRDEVTFFSFSQDEIRIRQDACANDLFWFGDSSGPFVYEFTCTKEGEYGYPQGNSGPYECPEGCLNGKCIVPSNETSYCNDSGYCKLYLDELLIFNDSLIIGVDYLETREWLRGVGEPYSINYQKGALIFTSFENDSINMNSGELRQNMSYDYNFSDYNFYWINLTIDNIFAVRDGNKILDNVSTPYIGFYYDLGESNSKAAGHIVIRTTQRVEPKGIININCKSGCILNDECYSYGYRKKGIYCSEFVHEFVDQKLDNFNCENNFECVSNLCVDGNCIEAGFFKKITNWFQRVF